MLAPPARSQVVGCLLYPICALLGLPACHPATVRSLAHVMALTSTEVVPLPDGKGATVRIVGVAEQRVTHLVIHILILVALAAGPVLKYVRATRPGARRARRRPHAAPR